MPKFEQASNGHVITGTVDINIPPLAGVRAGTTNPAGGLSGVYDARGYKSATLVVCAGVVTASTGAIAGKVQSSATSGGSYADITGAAVAGFGPSDDNTIQTVDVAIDPAEPFLKIVLTQAAATDVGAAFLILHDPRRS